MTTKHDVHFSSVKMDYGTPADLFAELNKEFRFTLDGAASPTNAKCKRFYCEPHWYRSQPRIDFLRTAVNHPNLFSRERIFINPPYGREIGTWIAIASRLRWYGATVAMLIPARTDTSYWHSYIWDMNRHEPRRGVQVRFLRGRIKFEGADGPAPFPSAVVVFDRRIPN